MVEWELRDKALEMAWTNNESSAVNPWQVVKAFLLVSPDKLALLKGPQKGGRAAW